MYEFRYQRPGSLAEALQVLAEDSDAKVLAGGMTLIPSMKHRLAAPSQLLDINRLPELAGIEVTQDAVTVGASVTHKAVAGHAQIQQAIPALAALAGTIGDPQVRVRGTLGGSLANNDPAADYPAAVLGLDAVVRTNNREIAADSFFEGMFTTALAPEELILQVRFARPKRAAYAKFHHPASGYAMTGVFVADFPNGVRVAVTGAGSSVFRWPEAEAALSKSMRASALSGLDYPADGLNADMHAPAQYRAHLVKVMATRAVEQIEADNA